ncbi:NAD(P)-dependent dehydrogenase, short-chain alcohol dehydrogenase family [Friedmanniella luteola]|uniref:NAD(P)-dependent dehydrogenase, short-chain alcohol dehydrogenase family n=1 Tax=Friedmanniella luteola TaxID=546871 RepID=A0A1H1XWD0_9ACTN|nr:SDR family NAD(P)-dependent oxidoreductase [Friedmanniella luteola]SDT13547.1 NAD(P)-dependent dehydrogenase, short-chain alcohol dehydrogenase family [Friedmanniella luteola]
MATVLVTGSSDGIGRQTALDLVTGGHRVVLHARSDQRAEQARAAVPGAADVVVGDLASLASTRALGEAVAALGPLDAVVHNAGVGGQDERRLTEDGHELIFQVNVLAPYLLTALAPPPARLVYLTSGLQAQGEPHLDDLDFASRPWNGMQAYSDSKLWDVVLALAVARHWPGTLSNAVDPGWIKTRMGGSGATDELPAGAETSVWLATSDDAEARVTGRYLHRRRLREPHPAATDVDLQEQFLATVARLTGVGLPTA